MPLGGAKGGIDFDPDHDDTQSVLQRYVQAMAPLITTRWNLGEDLGVRQDAIDEALRTIGIPTAAYAARSIVDDPAEADQRMDRAFNSWEDGLRLDELIGGYGVAESCLEAASVIGENAGNHSAFIQGFGSMGGATARYLHRAGVRIVGISDVDGVLVNPDRGLSVEHYLAHRDSTGRFDRENVLPGDIELPRDSWIDQDCDILVPAAVSYCIDSDNQHRVKAKLLVEAANLPVTESAETLLAARGIPVIPDFVANSATNAWWWWCFFGDIDGSPQQSFAQARSRMRTLTRAALDLAQRQNITVRNAGLSIAAANLTRMQELHPDPSELEATE